VMVGHQFADVLDGCSYCTAFPWHGDWDDLQGAMKLATDTFDEVFCTQIYSRNYVHNPVTDSFCKDSWAQIGRTDWGSLPLVFDLRDPVREQRLLECWAGNGKPAILVNTRGNSSPFQEARDLEERIFDEFDRSHQVVPLDFNCERFYDLLALYDRARCLVTIDTATLHLAHASPVPTVALISSTSEWHGTPKHGGQVLRMRYNDYPKNRDAFIAEVYRAIEPRPKRTLIHVYSDYNRDGDAQRRHDVARVTWDREYKSGRWLSLSVQLKHVPRHSGMIGDPRPVPFVNDMVAETERLKIAEANDLIVLTNDDISLAPGLTDTLMKFRGDCAFSNRRDFKSINRSVSTIGLASGHHYPGTDLFAFTLKWWREQNFPDMYLARNQFDYVIRSAMQLSGASEIPVATAHEQHPSFWSTGNNENTNPANLWNRKQATNWFLSKGLTPP